MSQMMLLGCGSSGPGTPASNWILATGAWNDAGVWDDAETWNDS